MSVTYWIIRMKMKYILKIQNLEKNVDTMVENAIEDKADRDDRVR